MTWLAWRQFRAQAAVALGALVLIAIVLLLTGPHLVHLYDTTVANCSAQGDCSAATSALITDGDKVGVGLRVVVEVVPALIGLFWGAPLVARELETGTYRLAWTQVTRTRWMTVKIGILGLASMVVAGVLSLMVTWWSSPLDRVNMNIFGTFDQRDIVPVGYAAFSFALGVTAGVLIRRTLPAMATTLAVFVAARTTFSQFLRPQLMAPVLRHLALNPATTGYGASGLLFFGAGPSTLEPSPPDTPNAWVISTQIVDKAGHALSAQVLKTDCPLLGKGGLGPVGQHSSGPVPAAAAHTLHDCVVKIGATYHELVTYQPASHYWALQWYELAIFLGAALILGGFCFWWVRNCLA